jgi:galactokinase
MKLNYFQKIMFSFLGVISGILNLVTSLLGMSPTWDLDGSFLKRKMEAVYLNKVNNTTVDRENAEHEYRKRVRELTAR